MSQSNFQVDEQFSHMKQVFKKREEDYMRRLEEGMQSYVLPFEQLTPRVEDTDHDGQDDLATNIFQNIRQIAELHHAFQILIPPSTGPKKDWARFLRDVNLAMEKIYVDYVAHIPLAVKRSKVEYLWNATYRSIVKMQRWNSSIYRGIIYILTRNFCVTFQSFPELASNLLTLDPPPPKFTTMPVWICSAVCPLITGSTGTLLRNGATKWPYMHMLFGREVTTQEIISY